MNDSHDRGFASIALAPWHLSTWEGPVVEVRPPNTPDSTEWPQGAIERVVFTPEQFPDYPTPDELPYIEHFGADGWQLHTPESVKPRLDRRMQAELRRWPWTTRPEKWNEVCWLRFASDYDRFTRWNIQAALTVAVIPVLPTPP